VVEVGGLLTEEDLDLEFWLEWLSDWTDGVLRE
jgi:hypothetical protein